MTYSEKLQPLCTCICDEANVCAYIFRQFQILHITGLANLLHQRLQLLGDLA